MTNTVNTAVAETAFAQLCTKYRKSDFTRGSIYFGTLHNGLTLNLFLGQDGTVRLWRFVCSDMPLDQAGAHFAYRKPGFENAVIGLVVTEEGDLKCYAEQQLDPSDPQLEARIRRQLKGFASIISNMDFQYAGSLLTKI